MSFAEFIESEPVVFSIVLSAVIVAVMAVGALCLFFFTKKKEGKAKPFVVGGTPVPARIAAGGGEAPENPTGENRDNPCKVVDRGITDDEIREFLSNALYQTKILFWLSACATVIGFLVIAAAIVVSIVTGDAVVAVESAPGVVINIIASLFFKQVHDTRANVNSYLHTLLREEQTEMSMEYAGTISDDGLRPVVQAKIALHMAGMNEKIEDLQKCIGGSPQAAENNGQTG